MMTSLTVYSTGNCSKTQIENTIYQNKLSIIRLQMTSIFSILISQWNLMKSLWAIITVGKRLGNHIYLSISFCYFLLFIYLFNFWNPFALHFSSSMIHRCQISVNIKYKIYFCLHPLTALTIKQPPFVPSPTRKSLHKTYWLPPFITLTLHTSISEFSILTQLKDTEIPKRKVDSFTKTIYNGQWSSLCSTGKNYK